MSANRDKSQKVAFVYSNLYQIYRKGVEAAQKAQVPAAEPSKHVLKVGDLHEPSFAAIKVSKYSPVELIGKRIQTPIESEPAVFTKNPAIESLKANLKALTDLQARLRFMLKELEDLVKD